MTVGELVDKLTELAAGRFDEADVVIFEPHFARWWNIDNVQVGPRGGVEIVSGEQRK